LLPAKKNGDINLGSHPVGNICTITLGAGTIALADRLRSALYSLLVYTRIFLLRNSA